MPVPKAFHRWYRARPLFFGHRGARQAAPENTLAAFRRALEMGADGVELDVQLSSDGVPVVIHDWTLGRTTDGHGPVARHRAAGLQALDAGGWFAPEFSGERIPTLEEVLAELGTRLLINIELKARGWGDGGLAARVATLVRGSGLEERVLVSSFHPPTLFHFRREMPQVSLALLTAPDQPLPLREGWLRSVIRPDTLHPHYSQITPAFSKEALQRGYRLNTWTVNDPDLLPHLWRRGVGMVCTDVPDALTAATGGTHHRGAEEEG
ncbi:MAG: glycerophosphodiester phosphodiesterase [Chloroflexi bacterium]|nr:glycerophosphodiester phosphodiesterase [Chloroflexota bacterium]